MKIDLRKKISVLPPIRIGDKAVEEVTTYKLLHGTDGSLDWCWSKVEYKHELHYQKSEEETIFI